MSFWLSSMSMHSCMLDPSMAIRKGDHFVEVQQKSCNNVLGSIANGWVLDSPTKQSKCFAVPNAPWVTSERSRTCARSNRAVAREYAAV